jgi:hypothetical protein
MNIQKSIKTTFQHHILIVLYLTIIIAVILISACREFLNDKSDEFALSPNTEIENAINVYHPYDGFEIEPGETLTIKWQTKKEIDWVDIFLYRKSTQTLSIAVKKKNSNEYAWNIPSDLHWSLHYSIKVQNHYDDEDFDFSDTFSIIVR